MPEIEAGTARQSEAGTARQSGSHCSRSVCLVLACLALALHLLLVLFCLSVLRTSCFLPPLPSCSSSSSSSSSSSPASRGLVAHKAEDCHKMAAATKGPIEAKMSDRDSQVGGRSKLKALFSHPLYNLPRPQLQEDDWLLRFKPETEEKTMDEALESFILDSEWPSDSEEDGYDRLNWTSSTETHPPWLRFHLGISRWELYDRTDPSLTQLTHDLATQRILTTVQKTGGTQLKLMMSFSNHGEALLKPMKQERDVETDLNLFYFSDFERHNAEIAAFHLDRILGFRRVPPVVGRLINVTTEIRDITTDRKLSRTFFNSPVGNVCFFGQCEYYCSTEHAVCGRPHVLEASLASMLPDLSLAPRRYWSWQQNPEYCDMVKQTPPYSQGSRLVDLVDMAILDFLMGNMDRHQYETFEKFGNETFLLHLDNGRGFGRHSVDELSILAPLQQCCRIRVSTLQRLRLLSLLEFHLSDVMRESLSQDPLVTVAPLLSEQHLQALDRRLATVLQIVHTCQNHHDDVLYNDE
ncbi:extracellular serine/threonine protein kinase FAM20C-like isoform X2 [Osmerus eperlanus]|uniref:extracellular serine/threonine protein kinase FAM20C-like isoform X2 n=1 Tax=Osmerus eperlanus TaxID=29151 RepID=UPI002E103A9D